ncbi:MAG: hypothetical protein K0R27_3341 [Xanthobacteraceae bacterium]|jgi:uncharacterized membrane protein (DUF4010 family)|nr:hypothetical protein [Xanthobacteraceae bacterium]
MNGDLAFRLALALAIGLVVGVERGWRERKAEPGSRTAGVRTYTLIGLLGGVFGALGNAASAPLLVGAGFIGFAAVFAWFKRAEAVEDRNFSVTGTVAAMLVYGLGAFAVIGDMQLAAAAGIATAAVLASREYLHSILARLTWIELRSALLLLGMTAIVLPLLPDRPLDPLGAVNPREIWLFTIFVAGLSYAGYIAMRVLGPDKGILVTGVTGGLVSSTAIAVAFARRAADGEDAGRLVAGAAAAGAVSLLRVMVLVGAIVPSLGLYLAPVALIAATIFCVPAFFALRRPAPHKAGKTELGNPFDLVPVLGFAMLLAAVMLLTAWATQQLGSAGLYPLAALSGLVDVDAVALSTARLAGGSLDLGVATVAILLALASNALARLAYAALIERGRFALRYGAVTLSAVVAGVATALLTGIPLF